MSLAILGLGGNIGDPRAAMAAALRLIDAGNATRVVGVSRLYRTPPWGKLDQPDFLNACALVETGLAPEALLDACLAVERALKRERLDKWGPRTIDLDIIDFEGLRMSTPRLTLPHPRARERAFVLVPLGEIAPDRPLCGRSAADWLAELDAGGIVPASPDGEWWRVTQSPSAV